MPAQLKEHICGTRQIPRLLAYERETIAGYKVAKGRRTDNTLAYEEQIKAIRDEVWAGGALPLNAGI